MITSETMTFSEVIKVRDGVFYNLAGHEARAARTAMHHFGHNFGNVFCNDFCNGVAPGMVPETTLPTLRAGLVKCRVVYGRRGVESVEFAPYEFRTIRNVAIVHDDTIEYSWKSTDRSRLNALLAASGCDEIVIVKNGMVTDTSSANIVLEDTSGALYTPCTPLLPGTKRASLLERGIIAEREVRVQDLRNAAKIYLINAMIDLEDGILLPLHE